MKDQSIMLITKTHAVVTSDAPKEEMLNAYAEWSASYDKDLSTSGYVACAKLAEVVSPYLKSGSQIRLLDVGCGTGLSGSSINNMAMEKGVSIYSVGLDYSEEMLKMAREKSIYDDLITADVNENLPVDDQSFDVFIAVGLFVAGHCRPHCLPNIVRSLKQDGVGVITIRVETFNAEKEEYMDAFKKSGVDVVSTTIGPYLGPDQAYYVSLRKKIAPTI